MNNRNEYNHLDTLAISYGTDKSSHWHDYTDAYSTFFAPLREKDLKFLEIGIGMGNSVPLWEEYFTKAELHFIDLQKDLHPKNIRSHYHVVDQANANELNKFIENTGGNFDIIIDDGGHKTEQQITSFKTLFPHLTSRGIYIIEDLHTAYAPEYTAGYPGMTTMEFLKDLVEKLNSISKITHMAGRKSLNTNYLKNLDIFQKEILSISFYSSLAVVIKR